MLENAKNILLTLPNNWTRVANSTGSQLRIADLCSSLPYWWDQRLPLARELEGWHKPFQLAPVFLENLEIFFENSWNFFCWKILKKSWKILKNLNFVWKILIFLENLGENQKSLFFLKNLGKFGKILKFSRIFCLMAALTWPETPDDLYPRARMHHSHRLAYRCFTSSMRARRSGRN